MEPGYAKRYAEIMQNDMVPAIPTTKRLPRPDVCYAAKIDKLDRAIAQSITSIPQPNVCCSPITMRTRTSRGTTA